MSTYQDLTKLIVKELQSKQIYRLLNIDETGYEYVLTTRRNCPNYNFEFTNGLVSSDSSGLTPPTTAPTSKGKRRKRRSNSTDFLSYSHNI